ncbi:MAG: chorismate--pyruvate lyase [Hespellia sp.]|nr:chorismate--pyruvate lyase [Hespellia sp.]
MFSCTYYVDQIDGDYAHLLQVGIEDAQPKLVARALLPAEVEEGNYLLYEWLQYTIIDTPVA